jgi:alkylated DNA repair dioxygenase AlkB
MNPPLLFIKRLICLQNGDILKIRRFQMVAPVEYIDGFIGVQTSAGAFEILWSELNWERRAAPGKIPRRIEYWTNIYGRSYTYGRGDAARTYEPQETHSAIESVTDLLEEKLGFRYEACFLNGYDGEKTGLEWHSDDDPSIDHSKPIAVVTLYDEIVTPAPVKGKPAARILQTKDRETGEVESFPLLQGSLLLMAAGMQDTHFHRIPKPASLTRPRISLTYRSLLSQ